MHNETNHMVICKYARVCGHSDCAAHGPHAPMMMCGLQACIKADPNYPDAVCVPVESKEVPL